MRNREKFKDEFDELLGYYIAVKDGKPCKCDDIKCSECELNGAGSCMARFREWLDKEYKGGFEAEKERIKNESQM